MNQVETVNSSDAQLLTLEEAIAAVRQVLDRRGHSDRAIGAETAFKDLQFDSLDVAELVVALEERAGCALDPKSAGKVETVGDLLRLRPR